MTTGLSAEQDPRTDMPGRAGGHGAELASAPLPSCLSLLMARLVPTAAGQAVNLGRHPIAPDGVRPAYRPLRLELAALPRARRLAEAAVARLPGAAPAPGGIALLGEDEDLGATLSRLDDGAAWLSLVRGRGLVALPAGEAHALAKVLRAAECELAERGLAVLDRGAAN